MGGRSWRNTPEASLLRKITRPSCWRSTSSRNYPIRHPVERTSDAPLGISSPGDEPGLEHSSGAERPRDSTIEHGDRRSVGRSHGARRYNPATKTLRQKDTIFTFAVLFAWGSLLCS